jgi:hypothetical protein
VLSQGIVDPVLNTVRVETIVVAMAAAVQAPIAHVRDENVVIRGARSRAQEIPPPESREQTWLGIDQSPHVSSKLPPKRLN